MPTNIEDRLLQRVRQWGQALGEVFEHRDEALFNSLFLEDAKWRDVVAFTWNLRQVHDREAIRQLLWSVLDSIRPDNLRLDESKPSPTVTAGSPSTVEFFFEFETAQGHGEGLAILAAEEDGSLRCQTLFTQLVSLVNVEPQWPRFDRFDVTHPDVYWSEYIRQRRAYEDRDPEVLIAGGGQYGVQVAAELSRLGVDALIVDKQPRVGDAWRSRYEALILHQPHGMMYFSQMKFPPSYPEYIPKDKFAEWFEIYVNAFDLNFWTSTEFVGAEYDEEKRTWTARLRLEDGSVRVMHPKHVVLATGGTEIPADPGVEGLNDFTGEIMWSGEFRSGAQFSGKRVLIVGAGTSAHDYAHDIQKAGGSPTLLQRSPLSIVDLPTANALYGDYNGREVPTELVDKRFMASFIYPDFVNNLTAFTQAGNAQDVELHEGLTKAGFKVLRSETDRGFFMKYFERLGGYYINVGASNAIIDGKISVLQTDDADRVVAPGLRMQSGETIPFDAIVMATGYKNVRYTVERRFGKDVADRIGDVWGFDAGGEMRNVWKPIAQEGLWIMMGGIAMARWYSPAVAMFIKADLDGTTPTALFADGHPARTPREEALVDVEV